MKEKKFRLSRVLLVVMSLVFVFSAAVCGTMAWLVDQSDSVVNTFTYGDINIDLEETDTNKDGDNDPNTNNYPRVPGQTITKDPTVTVLADSEDAWLFVKLEKSANFDTFMTYEMADGWTALAGEDGVYYREVAKTAADAEFYVIKDNKVNVLGTVTKEMLNALDSGSTATYPTLTITAYAVQRDNNINTATDAWAKVVAPTTPTP